MSNLVSYANPLQGTRSNFDFSTGNTYPAIARPFGMNFWSPQTNDSNWFYQYNDHKHQGIRCTHQPSPWMGDYGQFLIMPVVGAIHASPLVWASSFRHSEEVAQPHYYRVLLRRYNIQMEITPTERAACFRFSFPTTDQAAIVFKFFSSGELVIDAADQRLSGIITDNSSGVPDNFACYFVAKLDTRLGDHGLFEDQTGGYIRFEAETSVTMKVATSFISHEQAWRNLERETGGKSFDDLREETAQVWNNKKRRRGLSSLGDRRSRHAPFFQLWARYR